MSVIKVEQLTKDYGFNRGVFDVSFEVQQGEVFGFLGPNGAGKTTTIRHIMGFSRPQVGKTSVNGLDSWTQHDIIQRDVGYLPGEIALPEYLTGTEFINMMAELRGMKDMSYTNKLVEQFELDATGGLKRMSLGTKRKLAVVTAFMHDPAVLVLDEPTSGLDPIARDEICEILLDFVSSKTRSVLFSTHITSDLEKVADSIVFLVNGKIHLDDKMENIISNFSNEELKTLDDIIIHLHEREGVDYEKNI